MFWLRNKTNNFPVRTLIWRLDKKAQPFMNQPMAHWGHSTRSLGGQTSVPVPVLYDVPQGSVADLLPRFMNDLLDNIKSYVRLSVDEGLSYLRKIYRMRETRHQHHIQIQLIIHLFYLFIYLDTLFNEGRTHLAKTILPCGPQ